MFVAGRASQHINNWQHVQMYVCFIMSGVADVLGWLGLLPHGAEKAFLSLAFTGVMAGVDIIS
jgi:hypothetical protein